MSNLSYAILGTGALGGFYGARLQRAGLKVHFLLHQDYQHVKHHGLVIESVDGDFTLPKVHAYCDVHQMPRCDVVAVALKTTQNNSLPEMLPALVKDDGVVLVLQNGLGIEEQVAQIVGPERVIGGLCFVCSNKIGPGHIRHLDYREIWLAAYQADSSQTLREGEMRAPTKPPQLATLRMQQIAEDFAQAGIPTELGEDLLLARWRKLVWNIPFNGLSVVLNATTQELMADGYSRSLVEQLMDEVASAAQHCMRTARQECLISHGFIQQMLDSTVKMKPYYPSMKIDYDQRRPMEVEAIFGTPLRVAQQAGAQSPQIAMLYQQLKFLDAQNCPGNNPANLMSKTTLKSTPPY
ncbi:MAG TPA: putative 2-dehydropantoate 2-reductase [Candidatus Caenarcaniphilales bacterium]